MEFGVQFISSTSYSPVLFLFNINVLFTGGRGKKRQLGKKIAKDYFTAFVPTLKFWCSGEGEERELIRFVENKAGK